MHSARWGAPLWTTVERALLTSTVARHEGQVHVARLARAGRQAVLVIRVPVHEPQTRRADGLADRGQDAEQDAAVAAHDKRSAAGAGVQRLAHGIGQHARRSDGVVERQDAGLSVTVGVDDPDGSIAEVCTHEAVEPSGSQGAWCLGLTPTSGRAVPRRAEQEPPTGSAPVLDDGRHAESLSSRRASATARISASVEA